MIYKCKGEDCRENENCRRFNAPVDKNQVWITRQNGINGECNYYFKWNIKL